jgi:hypothetical protein
MSARSIVPEGVPEGVLDRLAPLRRWIDAPDPHGGVAAFRRAFAAIWLAYDVDDVVGAATERSCFWLPHPRSSELVVLQLVLVACGLSLVRGRRVWVAGMVAAAARTAEALAFFSLNDFYFGSVMYLLLAHSDGGPFARGPRPECPRWVRDVLLLQIAWVYAATAVLKLSPDWLDGGHLYVRTQYLAHGPGWPYPALLERALASTAVDAWLAKAAVAGELGLAVVAVARRPYWLGAALAVCIHGFGTLVTNVWFFSATMIAAMVLLVPRSQAHAAVEVALSA